MLSVKHQEFTFLLKSSGWFCLLMMVFIGVVVFGDRDYVEMVSYK